MTFWEVRRLEVGTLNDHIHHFSLVLTKSRKIRVLLEFSGQDSGFTSYGEETTILRCAAALNTPSLSFETHEIALRMTSHDVTYWLLKVEP